MAIDVLTEEVASNLEEVAQVTRQLNSKSVSLVVGGILIGASVGFYIGMRYNREKIKAEAFENAEEELSGLRNLYMQKMVAHTNQEKPSVEQIVEDKGYSQPIPERERPLKAPVPVYDEDPVEIEDIPEDALDDLPEQPVGTSKSRNANWDYGDELEKRGQNPGVAYVIHQDEYNNSQPDYAKLAYMYFEVDDVIVDTEDNHPIPHADIVIGQENLNWGHGSDDVDIVHIRNDSLNMDVQILRVYKSYDEEVLGLTRHDEN